MKICFNTRNALPGDQTYMSIYYEEKYKCMRNQLGGSGHVLFLLPNTWHYVL